MLPATLEFKSECITVRDVMDPTVAELDADLAATDPRVPRLQEDVAASDTVAVCKTTIAPLALGHPLLGSPSLTPINAWNIITARAAF